MGPAPVFTTQRQVIPNCLRSRVFSKFILYKVVVSENPVFHELRRKSSVGGIESELPTIGSLYMVRSQEEIVSQNQLILHVSQWPRCASAARSGASETRINPSYGEYISRINRIAPEAERADANTTAMTVPLGGARRPQTTNVTVNQKTMMTSNGLEMDRLTKR